MLGQNPEFSLHIHKRAATADHEDLYTIGLWQGSTLFGVCYVQPVDRVLAALRGVLEETGKQGAETLALKLNEAAPRRSIFRNGTVAVVSSLASFLKSIR